MMNFFISNVQILLFIRSLPLDISPIHHSARPVVHVDTFPHPVLTALKGSKAPSLEKPTQKITVDASENPEKTS